LLTPNTASRSSIRTLMRASWPRRTREAGPEEPPAPKNVSKMSWNAKPWPAYAPAAEPVVRAVLVAGGVIHPALLGIRENFVGVGHGLEPVRNVLPGINVRVEGAGQLAVGLLNLFAGSVR
jgi:hypothetical protein